MRINPMPVYQKGQKRNRSNKPNAEDRKHWEEVRALGCAVCRAFGPEIHHCKTGAGGRKDHKQVIPLCYFHHRGSAGIHTVGRREWQRFYGTEDEHLAWVDRMLGIKNP